MVALRKLHEQVYRALNISYSSYKQKKEVRKKYKKEGKLILHKLF